VAGPGAPDPLSAGRLAAQGLTDRAARTPLAVVRHLLAVQAQDLRAARLAIRARSRGLTAGDVDDALDRGEIVVDHLMRGTLHLVAAEDHGWLHALTAHRQAAMSAHGLAREGLSPAEARRGVGVIAAAVGEGPHTRAELRARLEAEGVHAAGQALAHLLLAASIAGVVVRGPLRGREQALVDRAAWVRPRAVPTGDEALARLGTRYLAGHAPATPADLAWWAGITRADAARALGPARPAPGAPAPAPPAPVLLGAFDPALLGWTSREWLCGPHCGEVAAGGMIRAAAVVDGRVVGTWTTPGGRVALAPLESVPAPAAAALAADAADVERFLATGSRAGRR
jgi:hypothetical protein